MVISFVVWGSLTSNFSTERLISMCIVYLLALGVSAHCLDAIGSKKKPWGVLSKKKIVIVSLTSLLIACAIGLYYAFLDSPLLFPIGIAELFFLFSYNLELFNGKFHNNFIFALSWGSLPVLAGATIQTNFISIQDVSIAGGAFILSYFLIITSKKYKKLRQQSNFLDMKKQESLLKLISYSVIIFTILYVILRYA